MRGSYIGTLYTCTSGGATNLSVLHPCYPVPCLQGLDNKLASLIILKNRTGNNFWDKRSLLEKT